MANNPICPPECTAPLPEVTFTDCNPPIHLSEIEWILFARPGAAAISDMTSATVWNARINNQGSGADAIRMLRVTGNMPAPTDNEAVVSGQRRITLDRAFTVDADLDELSDKNWEAHRQLQCGGSVKYWFVTRSGHIFGGADGILVSLKGSPVLDRGEAAFQKIIFNASWKSKFSPERHVWPIYGTTSSEQLSYDTSLTFAATTVEDEAGVEVTVPASDAQLKFEYNSISPRTGAAQTMNIEVGGVPAATVDYTADYNGRPFKFTDAAGTVFTGNFANATLDF